MKSSVRSVAVFYSKNSNICLAKKVKDTLSKFNTYTLYLNDIDDVILKNFSAIDYLILDNTTDELDFRSMQLLDKLHSTGYISNILEISKNNKKQKFDWIELSDEFETNLNNYFIANSKFEKEDRLVSKPSWLKIIGDYLVDIGISSKHSGYFLLVDAFIYFISNNCIVNNLVGTLYPFLSNKYKIKIASVEMRIRNTISIAFKKSDKFPFRHCPTIREFISHTLTQIYEKLYTDEVIKYNLKA